MIQYKAILLIMNILDLIDKSYKNFPEKEAIIDIHRNMTLTYKDLFISIDNLTFYFLKNKIKPQEKIGLYFENSIELIICFFGLLKINASPVLLDHQFCEREITQCLELTETNKILFCDNKKGLSKQIYSEDQKKELVIKGKKLFGINDDIYMLKQKEYSKFNVRSDAKTHNSQVILFSYRGLGYPLPVIHNEKGIVNSIMSNNHLTKVNFSLKIPLLLPFSHIFGLTCNILSPLSVGGTIFIIRELQPGKMLSAFEKYKMNFLLATPTLVKVLIHSIRKGNYDLSELRHGIVGGDTFPIELFREWRELTGNILVQGYGLTETCPVISNEWNDRFPGSLGKPMQGVHISIRDNKGNEVEPNKKGRLWIRSSTNMTGYYKMEKLNNELLKNSWFDTGDIAYMENNRYIYFVNRDKDIAKIGGTTVDIKEVLDMIKRMPKVNNVSINIEKDTLWQEKLSCIIESSGGLSKEDIIKHCRDTLSSSKIPKNIIFKKTN